MGMGQQPQSQVATTSRDGRVVVFDVNAGSLPSCLVSDIEARDVFPALETAIFSCLLIKWFWNFLKYHDVAFHDQIWKKNILKYHDLSIAYIYP